MIYSSMNGDIRQENFEDFFNAYYEQFSSILALNSQPTKFTLPMLKKEFYAKNIFGFILGATLIPMILLESEDAVDLAEVTGEGNEEKVAQQKEKVMRLVQKNPSVTSRLLSMFDEMKQKGLTDSVLT